MSSLGRRAKRRRGWGRHRDPDGDDHARIRGAGLDEDHVADPQGEGVPKWRFFAASDGWTYDLYLDTERKMVNCYDTERNVWSSFHGHCKYDDSGVLGTWEIAFAFTGDMAQGVTYKLYQDSQYPVVFCTHPSEARPTGHATMWPADPQDWLHL